MRYGYAQSYLLKGLEYIEFLTFDLEHILGMEILEIYKRGICVKQRLSGFHHDFLDKLEQSSLVQYVKQKVSPCGSFKGRIIINGMKFDNKSLFSPLWTEVVMKKILESLGRLITEPELQPNGNWKLIGQTKEGLKIGTIVDAAGKITSYPIID